MNGLRSKLSRFWKDESATLSVEAALVFPLLIWAYGGMYVYWDAFKMQNINIKAAYTISDMISREQLNIQEEYVDGLALMLDFLNRQKFETRLRVSVVGAFEDADGSTNYRLCWSQGRDGMLPHDEIDDIIGAVPVMAPGKEVIVVETEMDYEPIISAPYGLDPRTFVNTIVTQPRFVRGQVGYRPAGEVDAITCPLT